jgi:hypothetical protein
MKRIKVLIASFAVAVFGFAALAPVASVSAYDPWADVCNTGGSSTVCDNKGDNAQNLIGTIVNVLLFLVGALAVIMIIASGIFYVISSGDAGKVAKAKNTLTYSIVGLVVAFIAFALVNWVFKLF